MSRVLRSGLLRRSFATPAIATLAATGLIAAACLAMPSASADTDAAAAPAKGACLKYVPKVLEQPYGSGQEVDCAKPHNGEVFALATYPEDLGAPSTVGEDIWQYPLCFNSELRKYVTGKDTAMPLRVWFMPKLPTDAQWEAGARWVACTAYVPNDREEPATVSGSLPSNFAKAKDKLPYFYCAKTSKTPVSGTDVVDVACSAKSTWLLAAYASVSGEPGNPYPSADLQAQADANCAKNAKPVMKKGSKVLAIMPLKKYYVMGYTQADCFIAVSSWNGKV